MMPLTEHTGGDKLETTQQSPGRELLDGDITQLITELEQLFHPRPHQEHLDRITQTLSVMFRENQVSQETAQEIIGTFKLDIEILRKTYNYELTSDEEANTPNLNTLLKTWGVPGDTARHISRKVNQIIEPPRHYGQIVGTLGTDTLIIADPQRQKIYQETVVIKNEKDYSKRKEVIAAYPTELIVYDSPLSEEPRKFEITWKSKLRHTPLKTGPDLLEDIKNDLIRDGYVTANRLINDILPGLVNTYIQQDLADVKTDIETPGFFFTPSDNQLIGVHYQFNEPPIQELQEAIKVLHDLADWYTGVETKLATVFKWGLISPFIYSKKQQGNWTPWPYLYGKARSGKSTLGQMVLYMWNEPSSDNDLTGSGFDTVARVGGKISQSTYPIVVNEPAGAFQRVSIQEMLKGAIERTISRGRYEGRRYTNIPSFNPVIFTANQFVPDDDALIRRLLIINFTHNEKKTKEQIETFEREWQTRNHKQCKFNAFKSITAAAANEIHQYPELLELEWKELADTLIQRIYLDAGMDVPGWLLTWSRSENMEDLDEEHREDIKNLILNRINTAYGRVQVIDPETGKTTIDDYTPKLKGTDKFKERVWTVVNERLIPWMIPVQQTKDGAEVNYVCLTLGFKKEVHRELRVCQPLKGIAELMGWRYANVKLPEQKKVIKIRFTKFLEFLYPTGGE